MQQRTAIFKNIFLIRTLVSTARRTRIGLCAAMILIAVFSMATKVSAQADEALNLRGAEAVDKLRQNGQYDSLMEAMKAARRDERRRNNPAFTASEVMPPTAKLYAPDGAPANFFGYSVALSNETAVVGVPLDSLESVSPASVSEGSAYVFTRSGESWTLQQKLTASDGANRDYFGANVSIDGNTIVIGALFDDVGASANQGSAYIFTRSGAVWTEQAKLTAAQGAAGDRFGVSVEISGETVVVGTKRDQGAAYVFTRSGATWTQQQQLIPSNGAAGDEFGSVVTISGETIFVSATGRPVSGADDQGAVYVFTRAGGVWSEQQVLTALGGAAGDRFGSDLAISGNTAIIGAYLDDVGANPDQGSAYIFTTNGSSWSLQAHLVAANGQTGDHFGSSVAIGGNTAVVGAPDNDFPGVLSDTNIDQGSAYVFTGSGMTWNQQTELSQENVGGTFGDGARFGSSAAISGETILLGISGADNQDGLASVYIRSGTNWTLQTFLADDEDSSGDDFGYSVAIDGDTAVVGAPFDDLGASREQGSAYVFVRTAATNTWAFQAKLTASDGAPGIAFGSDVSISGNTIVVGTSIIFVSYTTSANAEAAYVFTRTGETWTQQQKLTPTDGAPGEAFGSTVSISGETIVVGAPFHGVGVRGAAYVFARAGGVWSQQQKLFVANPAQNATHYGYSVAVSGETVIVGAPRYGTGGQIYVYVRSVADPTMWVLQQIIGAGETNSCDAFGLEVALSGNTLITSTNRGLYTGAGCTIQNGYSVYIFARSGTVWAKQQKLHDSGRDVSDVAIYGDTAVFGTTARRPTSDFPFTAAVVFTRTGTSWTQREPLIVADDATSDGAADVAVFGSTVIVGATQDELDLNINQDVDFTSHQGSAYVFNVPDAPSCGFTLNPTGQSFASAGGNGSFTVTASSPNCSWIADSDSSWITVTSATSGTGNATISFSVAANQTTSPRTGTINVGGQIFTVTQAGIVGTIFTVLNTNDSGAGSLRDAITQAIATAESRTILFDQAAFSSPQTITLASNLLINSSNGGSITIIGPGANLLTITGSGARRIFTISSTSQVSISGMTLTAGNGTGSISSGNGGAIYNSAALTLTSVVINANATTGGGNFGGGIYSTIRLITLNDCVVSNNTTAGRGGGIYIDANVTATISASTFSNNTSNGLGGGIYSSAFSTLILNGSNITGNTTNINLATDGGGGIFTAATSFTMTDSTVSGNRAPNASGGGVSMSNSGTNTITRSTVSNNSAGASGGGLNFSNTQLSVTNSTISGNRAGGNGGGVNRNNDAPATQVFRYTTIAFNVAGNTGGGVNTGSAIQFNNSIVGSNFAQTSPDYAGALNSGGYNLIEDVTGATISGTTTGNVTGLDPLLDGVPRNNGGLTKTLALRRSSPAVDAANPADFPATDQRNLPRPVDGDGTGGARADIGAYERQTNDVFVPAEFDFDGDGRADLSVFRPSSGTWFVNPTSSSQTFYSAQFGLSSDKPAPADYDGDGKTDIAVWRESTGIFYIYNSSNGTVRSEQFGQTGDVPTSGDWDGDGRADLSVYRDGPQSYFFYRGSLNNPAGDVTYISWGTTGDRPVRGDFDGDGKLDAAVFRPSDNVWYIRQSSNGSVRYESFGLSTDKFVPADYDGDGKTDLAVFRNGVWYIKQSSNSQIRYETFGLASDVLVPADYDGDGRTDVAVWRDGTWYIQRSSAGTVFQNFGQAGDAPVPNVFVR